MLRLWIAIGLLLMTVSAFGAEGKFALQDGQRVVFLGDSITNAGMYVQYVDAFLRTRFPDRKFDLLNLGLPSETVSGLSEPDHPYPRPDLHERLARVLTKTKPDVVVICYGMNDGIYYPFSAERFEKYQESIRWAVAQAKQAGAKVVLMTPPPFDAQPVKASVRPIGAEKYSWVAPYAGYDEVLTRYAQWLTTLRAREMPVADPHTAISRYLTEVRAARPEVILAGDGVHLNATGHGLIALQLLQTWNAPNELDFAEINWKTGQALHGTVHDIKIGPKEAQFEWQARQPMPLDPDWDAPLAKQFAEQYHHLRLTVRNAPQERYALYEGDRKLGEVTRKDLAEGINLMQFPDLSLNHTGAELLNLIRRRERLLSPAWLTYAGHKRPDTPAGLPLDEAQKQAAELEAQIQRLAQPVSLSLRLVPAEK